MSLRTIFGDPVYFNSGLKVRNPLLGVEIDYYFMAHLLSGSKTELTLKLWTVIIDYEGIVYGMCTHHHGHYFEWKEAIQNRIKRHLLEVGLDNLQVNRMIRDIEIKKKGHIIPFDSRTGDAIGINGSNELYIRKTKFTYIQK